MQPASHRPQLSSPQSSACMNSACVNQPRGCKALQLDEVGRQNHTPVPCVKGNVSDLTFYFYFFYVTLPCLYVFVTAHATVFNALCVHRWSGSGLHAYGIQCPSRDGRPPWFDTGNGKKNEHHGRPSRASATAPLRTGVDVKSGRGLRSQITSRSSACMQICNAGTRAASAADQSTPATRGSVTASRDRRQG